MNGATALQNLPEALLPPRFAGAGVSSGEIGSVLDHQRRCENLAYCHTVTAVYALFRDRYGERESAFLASETCSSAEFHLERRELSLAYSSVKAEISVSLRLGPVATESAIDQAIGFVERLPRVFTLIGSNIVSPRGGQEALSRARALTCAQALEFDERLEEVLTADPLQLTSLPALREAADRIVHDIDPVAAERRRRQAEEDRTLTIRPADDGMAAAYALLTAHEGRELGVRAGDIAATVCTNDPRTPPQRWSDGLMMLVRGYISLGCRCEDSACSLRTPRHQTDGAVDVEGTRVITRYRTLIHVIVNEKTLTDPANQDAAYLAGHGPLTAQHARDLAGRDDAVIRPFGDTIDDPAPEHPADGPSSAAAPDSDDADPAEATGDDAGDTEAPEEFVGPAAPSGEDSPAETSGYDDGPADASDDGVSPQPRDDPGAARAPRFRSAGVDFARRPPSFILAAARCWRSSKPRSGGGAGTPRREDGPETEVTSTQHPAPRKRSPGAEGTGVSEPECPPTPQQPGRHALVIAHGGSGYRFSAHLARYFALLFPRCVFPLCTRPSSRCQVDHRREFDHADPTRGGGSTAGNGQPLCLAHHQLKTAGIWVDAHLPDGRILWIGPAGQRIVVDPSGTVLGLFPDLTRVAWTTPASADAEAPPPKPATPGGPTHLQREHTRREALRAAHLRALDAERRQANTSRFERHLAAVLDGRTPAHDPPPDNEPPPF